MLSNQNIRTVQQHIEIVDVFYRVDLIYICAVTLYI